MELLVKILAGGFLTTILTIAGAAAAFFFTGPDNEQIGEGFFRLILGALAGLLIGLYFAWLIW